MIENWNDVHIVPEFSDQGVDCYRLAGGSFLNEYYIVSEAETRKLMNHPEVVGYEVYASLVTATSQMMYYLKEQKEDHFGEHSVHSARRTRTTRSRKAATRSISACMTSALCPVSACLARMTRCRASISNTASLTMVPNSTLMIGDIIASGETLVQLPALCHRLLPQAGRPSCAISSSSPIGGTQGIEILEKLTQEIRVYWPGFEGFVTVYYEGVFSCYEEGNKGVSGINRALIDFYWKGGIVAPAFRRRDALDAESPF